MYALICCCAIWEKVVFSTYCSKHVVFLPEMILKGAAHGWSVPLLPMLLSLPLWAIIISQMCSNWSYYTLFTSLPTYMDNILHFDLKSVKKKHTKNKNHLLFNFMS